MTDPGSYVGLGALALAFIAFIRFFLWRQITDLRADVLSLNDKIDAIEAKYDEERGLKHKAYNDVSRTVMALELVQRLAVECKCGVLSPLEQVVAKLVSELETLRHRRSGDDTSQGSTL